MENFQYQNWNLKNCKSQNTMCGIAIFISCFTNNHYTTIAFFFIHRCFYIFYWFLVLCRLLYWSGKNKFPSWQWHCSHFSFYTARCYLTTEGTFLLCECISVYFFYCSVLLYAFTSLYALCRHKSLSMLFQHIYFSTCLFKVISLWKKKIFLPSVNTCQNAEWIAHCCFKHKILLDSTVPFLALVHHVFSLCLLCSFQDIFGN